MTENAINHLPQIISALILLSITFLTARFIRSAIRIASSKTRVDINTQVLLAQIGYIFVWIFGSILTLSLVNINLSGIFAAIGVTGAVISFAVRDMIANIISGIILLSVNYFKVGDTILVEGQQGKVDSINIYTTTLKTNEGNQILIPNSKILGSNITNLAIYPEKCLSFKFKVAGFYAPKFITDTLKEELATASILLNPAPTVSLIEFNSEALSFEIIYWINLQDQKQIEVEPQIKEKLRTRLLKEKIVLV